jgi:Na+-translocating ferredoxin:NAD+ oxidoreductase subunit B
MAENIYEQLRERLDQFSVGFPKTESGVEIKILKKMFDKEEDAELYLQMTPMLQKPAAIAEQAGKNLEEVTEQLENMAKKGLIFRLRRGDETRFGASPFVIGSFEFQLKRMDRELAELVEQYNAEGFHKNMGEIQPPLRTVPVHQSVDSDMRVAPYQDAREIIKSKNKIAIADCVCRAQQNLIDKGCGKPLETCIVFGSHADYYVENGLGRYVDHEAVLKVLDKSEDAGLVVQPGSTINPGGICCCCGDCCGILRAVNLAPKPAEMVLNDYRVAIDPETCTGCETCTDRCQMAAITMSDDEIARVDLDRCIGCGLCVTTCPSESIALELKPEPQRVEPYANDMALWIDTAKKRGIDPTG